VLVVLNWFFCCLHIQHVLLGEIISIPGTQGGLANEHNLVTAIDDEGKSSI
jgi:hypothetical protein